MKHDMHPAHIFSAHSVLRFLTLLASAACATTLTSCVTINIYFPAAAAEKAADRIIEEVYQLRKDAAPAKPADAK